MSEGQTPPPPEETPSQAEGERDDMEEAVRGRRQGTPPQPPRTTPSQAEGDDEDEDEADEGRRR